MPDKELLRLIATGDEQAFATLFHQYRQMVYNVAWTYTEDAQLSEDILQDTFVLIWKKREKLPEISDFSAYLYVVARNQSTTALRKMATDKSHEDRSAQGQRSWEPDHTEQITEKKMKDLLAGALDTLTPQQRKVFELRRMQDRSLDDISEEMGISKNTVQNHLGIAIRRVRAFLLTHLDMAALIIFLEKFLKK